MAKTFSTKGMRCRCKEVTEILFQGNVVRRATIVGLELEQVLPMKMYMSKSIILWLNSKIKNIEK